MPAEEYQDVLRFWFPPHVGASHGAMVRQCEWWFSGGADAGERKITWEALSKTKAARYH